MALKINSIKRVVSDEGDWVLVPEWNGVRFKVRSIYYRPYQVARELLIQKLSRRLGRQPTGPEMEPELGRLVAAHLLLGWEGIASDDDKDVAWSSQIGEEYLTNPELRELENQVILAASKIGDTDAKFVEDAIKN